MLRLLCVLCVVGCIGLSESALAQVTAKAEKPTFTRDVAPILFSRCVSCHRPGNIAPFTLTHYEDARKRAKQIQLVTVKRVMPPWKPQTGHGEFRDSKALTAKEIAILANWAEAGAPEGDKASLPPLPKFREGWQLGKPDIILKMPKPFKVPATGNDIYVHFVFPLNLSKDVYVRGIECRPSNLSIAHHAVGLLDSSGMARKFDAETPEPGYIRFGGPGFVPVGITPGYVPGQTPRFFREGSAITIRKGTDLVLQMHYHPSGKEEADQTEIGLYLTDKPPTRHVLGVLLGSEEIDIPAGSDTFRARDSFVLPVPLHAQAIWAHMHLIGKEVRVWAELPNGTTEKLLWISDWDFRWQDTYEYQRSVYLPKGTTIQVESRFDNTVKNPRNPFNPPRRIRLGEQSTDEMLGVWVGGEVNNGIDLLILLGSNIGHYFEVTDKGNKFRNR